MPRSGKVIKSLVKKKLTEKRYNIGAKIAPKTVINNIINKTGNLEETSNQVFMEGKYH